MTKRLSAATCLVVAISTALGSLPVLAVNPLPLIGALLPTQDEESEFDADAHGEDEGDDAGLDRHFSKRRRGRRSLNEDSGIHAARARRIPA